MWQTTLSRVCCTCGEDKQEEEYYKGPMHSDGYYKDCKDCRRTNRLKKKDEEGFRCVDCNCIICSMSIRCHNCSEIQTYINVCRGEGEDIKKEEINVKNPLASIRKKLRKKLPTDIELLVIGWKLKGLMYTGNGKLELVSKRKHMFPDFKVLGKNKVVDLFGNYWHTKEEAKERTKRLKDIGYKILIIWGDDLKRRPEYYKKRIKRFIKR